MCIRDSLYSSPCRNACPASVDVPGYMNLVAAGRLVDAYRLIRQETIVASLALSVKMMSETTGFWYF